jgi:uncharacterized protein
VIKGSKEKGMPAPEIDFPAACRYALDRLRVELSPERVYHSFEHTRDEVVPAALRYAGEEGITGEELLLLETAACFHDIGFTEQDHDHETAGCRIAGLALPAFGFHQKQIRQVQSMILATRLPQNPHSLPEQTLCDADLDVLGKHNFTERNHDLHQEMRSYGSGCTQEEWVRDQLVFLESHSYFTSAARRARENTRQKNILKLKRMLRELQSADHEQLVEGNQRSSG